LSDLRGSRKLIALAIGLLMVALGAYILASNYEQLGVCNEGNALGNGGSSCAATLYYEPLLLGWALLVVGIMLSVIDAYYLGLSATKITRSEKGGQITL
jgi:hypothetical protein